MPRATLAFKLPEEAEEFKCAIQSEALFCAVIAFDEYLREKLKFADLDENTEKVYQDIRTRLYAELEKQDVTLW